MSGHRRERVNDAVAQELGSILREIKDPRITESFLTITGAEVAPDMKTAKIFFSTLIDGNLDQEDGKLSPGNRDVLKGLKSASGFIRRELARRLNLRNTPELTFKFDDSMRHGAKITAILNSIGTGGSDGDQAGE